MCHILEDTSPTVQRMTYQLLQEAAKKYTEHMVIEAAVDSEPTVKIEMPAELLILLQRRINQEEDLEQNGQVGTPHIISYSRLFTIH